MSKNVRISSQLGQMKFSAKKLPEKKLPEKKHSFSKELALEGNEYNDEIYYKYWILFSEVIKKYEKLIYQSYQSYAAASWNFSFRREDHISELCRLKWPSIASLLKEHESLFIEWFQESIAYPILVDLLKKELGPKKQSFQIIYIDAVFLEKDILIFQGKVHLFPFH